nr:metallophosphoesterase family protein [Lachnospiraceae bacterium]
MKILIIADEESKALWDFYTPERLEGIDLIISCGDLKAAYLEFLATMVSIPVLYVPGNHDTEYVDNPPNGCECIDGTIFKYKGIRILGLGGSMKYKNGPYMYTEAEMKRNIKKLRQKIFNNSGFDILVTHSPAKGYGDLDDLPHQGYECFNQLMLQCRPLYMLHGHVHGNYGWNIKRVSEHESGTTIINGFDRYVLDYDETKKNEIKRSELFFN